MTGPLESTNESYAIAKIAGLKMVEAYNREYGTRYLALMPTNLYGMNDNFDLNTSHVVPALLRKFGEARATGAPGVRVWGTGAPRREFLLVDDLADACLFCMGLYSEQKQPGFTMINVGSGEEVSIAELARMVAQTVGYEGNIEFDSSMPDGTPRKLLDSSRINALGWRARMSLQDGLGETYEWFLRHQSENAVEHSSH
jgi:GDP-L-fucose synthase